MKGAWLKVLLVGVPVLVTLLALAGELLIETEAKKFEAELDACIVNKDDSVRCRTLLCLAKAHGDDARADCIEAAQKGTTTATVTSTSNAGE